MTDRSAILKIPVLKIPPKFMYKKSVTDPNTILSKIFAIPPPIINEKPIIDNLSNDLSIYVYKVIDIKTITSIFFKLRNIVLLSLIDKYLKLN